MRVSVVLCTYALDAFDDFRAAADSVLAQTHPDVELVVVVDGSEAVHERVAAAYGGRDDVVVHCNDANRGLLASRNTGAELASGDVVAFIDDDAVAREDWVAQLVASYRAHDVAAVGGRMAPAWVAGRPAYLPAEFYWLVGVTHRGFADGPGEVRNTFGSNLSVRRATFREVGGFDPAIGGRKGDRNLQGGETELCARVRAATGRGVWYNPDAVVAHKVFDYRTRPRWLFERAFWQGYSKRAMETLVPASHDGNDGDATGADGTDDVPGDTDEETEFLRRLVTEFVPGRIGGLLRRPSLAELAQLLALVVLTAAVGAGYLYGLFRWGGAVEDRSDGTDPSRARVEGRTSGGPADGSTDEGTDDGEVNGDGGEPGDLDGVCVFTHPLGAAGENATRTLLAVLSAVTTASLVTADLPDDSAIRDEHEVIEVSRQGTGASVAVAAYRFLRNQVRMARTVRRREEGVALFFGSTAYLLPVLAARAAGKTVVMEPRGDVPLTLRLSWERRLPSPVARLLAGSVRALERLNYRLADAVVAYTPSMAAELGLDRYGGKLYATAARYVDTERFRPTTPFAERGDVVGFVGRLDTEKNVRALAAAAAGLPDGLTFRFVGDGPLRAELEREFAPAVADGRIEFVGWVDHDDVPAELNRLRLLVLPSRPTEGLPTTILESMACGTPALASPVSGVPDVVREGETGFHLTDRDPAAIRDRIVSILGRGTDASPDSGSKPDTDTGPDADTDVDVNLAAVSARARSLAVDEYSFEAAVDRYQGILTDLSGRTG